jgi:hypothetical protein
VSSSRLSSQPHFPNLHRCLLKKGRTSGRVVDLDSLGVSLVDEPVVLAVVTLLFGFKDQLFGFSTGGVVDGRLVVVREMGEGAGRLGHFSAK